MKKLLFVVLALALSFNLKAEIKDVKYSSKTVEIKCHEILDVVFTSKEKPTSPFETEFTANFVSPSGKELNLQGFYNGGQEWIVRFSASESGEWKYQTSSSLRSLNNKKGKITVSSKSYGNRRGMIVKSKEYPKNVFYEDGTPYFMMGFECDFLYALDYKNVQSTPILDKFLDGVARNGFNHIVMNVYATDVVWQKDEKLKSNPHHEFGNLEYIYPFGGTNKNPDHSTLNVEFFKKFDRTIEALNDRNIVSHLMIYVWNKAVNWPKILGDDDVRYFEYVIKRYQAFTNIVWDISKEALLYGTVEDKHILQKLEDVRRLDNYKRLVTVHDMGFCSRHSDKVDFISNQNWHLATNSLMIKDYNNFKDKPNFNIEHGGYEECDYFVFSGNYINAEMCLRRNWECAFAGVYSTYYWQGCSWNVIIYDWESLGDNHYKPKMHYFKHMTDFWKKYPFHTFVPDSQHNNSGYTMTNKKDTYLVYLPKESFRTSLKTLAKVAKRVSYQYFNTFTGEYSPIQESEVKSFFSPSSSPWHMSADVVLIVKVLEKR